MRFVGVLWGEDRKWEELFRSFYGNGFCCNIFIEFYRNISLEWIGNFKKSGFLVEINIREWNKTIEELEVDLEIKWKKER